MFKKGKTFQDGFEMKVQVKKEVKTKHFMFLSLRDSPIPAPLRSTLKLLEATVKTCFKIQSLPPKIITYTFYACHFYTTWHKKLFLKPNISLPGVKRDLGVQ